VSNGYKFTSVLEHENRGEQSHDKVRDYVALILLERLGQPKIGNFSTNLSLRRYYWILYLTKVEISERLAGISPLKLSVERSSLVKLDSSDNETSMPPER
jgi:hypothetical protein